MFRVLSLFIVVPFVELLIIIEIGSRIGFWPTLALIVIPGLLGAVMARSQGTAVFAQVRSEIARGRLPGSKIVDGILIFIGGVLLITPGILTDILGLTVLLPKARSFYRDLIIQWIWRIVAARSLRFYIKRPL